MFFQTFSKAAVVFLIQIQFRQSILRTLLLKLTSQFFPDKFHNRNFFYLNSQAISGLSGTHKNPVQIGSCSGKNGVGNLPARKRDLTVLFQGFPKITIRSGHDQLFFCTGHGNIKHTQLLTKTVQLHLSAQYVFLDGRSLYPVFCIQIICGNAQFRVNQHLSVHILFVEFLSHSGQKNNGEFQALTFMDTHDPHSVIFLSHCGSLAKIGVVLFQVLNVTNEVKQPLITRLFIFCCLLNQHIQIGPPGLPCRHGRDIIVVTGFLVKPIDQFMNGKIGSQQPEPVQLLKKVVQMFPAHSSRINSPVLPFVSAVPVICHHFSQLPVTHAHHRRF